MQAYCHLRHYIECFAHMKCCVTESLQQLSQSLTWGKEPMVVVGKAGYCT